MAVSSTNLDTALILRRTKQIELLPKVKVFLDSIARNSIKSKRSYSSGITLLQNFLKINQQSYQDCDCETILQPLLENRMNVYELLDSFVSYVLGIKPEITPRSLSLYITALRSYFAYYDIDVLPSKFRRKVKCKVHGFKNLYVCDASVFPTSLGVNPQITVMSLASMVAKHINKVWEKEYEGLNITRGGGILGETCSIRQPLYCSSESLDTMFNQIRNQMPVETLINVGEIPRESSRMNSSTGEKIEDGKSITQTSQNILPSDDIWSFDKNSLMIYNDKYWKGFFPVNQDFNLIRYFGGFWKYFYKEGQELRGITHPFDAPVYAPNLPLIQNYPGYGEVIYLKYTSPEFGLFYDLLKIVNNDTILGKAFLGVPPFGNLLLNFSMARRYNIDFMTEGDHQLIYEHHARAPTESEVIGKWTGKLVSDSALTPTVQVFTYTKDNIGKIQMQYTFGGLLRGISRVTLTSEQMNMYDFTNWHDEVKIVTNDFIVGKWCSPWTPIPLTFGPSFLSTESGPQGRRFCLRFTLRNK